jgi:uncharacterized protein YoxC
LPLLFFGDLTPVINAIKSLQTDVTTLKTTLASILAQQGKIMTDTDNLVTAVTALTTSVANLSTQQTAAVAAIETELQAIANANTGNSPAIAQAVGNIRAQTTSIDMAASALQIEAAKVTPPTPPSP